LSFSELIVSPVLSKEKVLDQMMFRRASLAAFVMLGDTIAPMDLAAIDKEYVRVNSTELGEEVEIDIEYEEDLNIRYQLVLRVDTVEQDPSLYCMKISTNHPFFKLQKSCVLRSFSSFYFLEKLLLSSTHDISPMLPLKPLLWKSSQKTKLQQLTNLLFQVLSNRDLVANMAVHLFLQTQLSMEIIKDNVEGRRHDHETGDENKDALQKPISMKEADGENWLKYILKRPVKGKEGQRRKSLGYHLELLSVNLFNILPIINE
jgi:hypothetical protein